MDYIKVTLPEEYPYVMLTVGLIAFECLIVGFLAGGKRGKIFKLDDIKEIYGDEHHKEFKNDPPKGGYPDHGDGLYGDMLTYIDWFTF